MLNDKLRNLATRIIEVPEHPDAGHAGCHASGFFTLLDKFDTEPALLNITLFLDDPHIVRAGGNAVLAANALVLVDQNNAVAPLVGSPCRTDLHAGWVITVLTLNGKEFTGVTREGTILALLQIVIGFLLFKAVLVMASDPAGVAAYTLRFVDHHPISRHPVSPQMCSLFDLNLKWQILDLNA
jgi:hypothetical protein